MTVRADLRVQIKAQLQKHILLRQGAVKLLNTPSITKTAKRQAQREFHESQEQITILKKQLDLLGRIDERKQYVSDEEPSYTLNSASTSVRNSPAKSKNNNNNNHNYNNGSSNINNNLQNQVVFEEMIENLRTTTIPEVQIDLSNRIIEFMTDSTNKNYLRMPSMSVIIPIVWPMLMMKHKLVNASAFRLLRYFTATYEDILILFYFYHKHNHHNRYYYYPYNEYEKIHNLKFNFDDESELLNVYSFQDKYKPNNNKPNYFDNQNLNRRPIASVPINSVTSDSSRLTISSISENQAKKWWPLLYLIVKTMVQEKGLDVIECIKFIRKVIELKGINFLTSLGIRILLIVVESNLLSFSVKINNFQNISQSTMESIKIIISITECICEATVANPQLSYECNGIKFLIEILIDPPFTIPNHQLQQIISNNRNNNNANNLIIAFKNLSTLPLPIILYLLISSKTRIYITDIGLIPLLLSALLDPLINFSNSNNVLPSHIHFYSPKLHHLSGILSIILCSWSGLGLFLENDYKYLKVLIEGLYSEQVIVRTVVMSIIAGSLRIRKLKSLTGDYDNYELWDWEKIFIKSNSLNGKDYNFNNQRNKFDNLINDKIFGEFTLSEIRNKLGGRCCPEYEDKIVNQFTSIFLQSCLKCGLVKILKKLFKKFQNDKRAIRWIALLLSEIEYLKSQIIPNFKNDDDNLLIDNNLNKDEIINNDLINIKMNRLIERESFKHAKLNKKIKDERNLLINKLIKKSDILSKCSEEAILSIFLKSTTISSLYPFIQMNKIENDSLIEEINIENILTNFKKYSSNIDIKPLIIETKILSTKEYKEWNWVIICILIRGILWNDYKFEEILKTTKFFKRLISFFKPQKSGFVKILYNFKNYNNNEGNPGFNERKQLIDFENFKDNNDKKLMNEIYIDVGVSLFELLISKREGVEVLIESKILENISISLFQICEIYYDDLDNGYKSLNYNEDITDMSDVESVFNTGEVNNEDNNNNSNSNSNKNEGLFGINRMKNTLSWGYIRFIGVLSKHPIGIKLIEEVGIIDAIYRIINLKIKNGNEIDFTKILIEEIDFRYCGQIRILFEKLLIIGEDNIKIIIIKKVIGLLLGLNFIFENKDYTLEKWCLQILIRSRYDYNLTISEIATKGLIKYIKNEEDVKKIIEMNPDLNYFNSNENGGGGGSSSNNNNNNENNINTLNSMRISGSSNNNNLNNGDEYYEDEVNENNIINFNKVNNSGGNGNNSNNVKINEEKYQVDELLKAIIQYDCGIEYLQRRYNGIIENIVERWIDERFEWVKLKEINIYERLRCINEDNNSNNSNKIKGDFLIELLLLTSKGLEIVVSSGIVEYFIKVIKNYVYENEIKKREKRNRNRCRSRKRNINIGIDLHGLNNDSFEEISNYDNSSNNDFRDEYGYGFEGGEENQVDEDIDIDTDIENENENENESDDDGDGDGDEESNEEERINKEYELKSAIMGIGIIGRTEEGMYLIEELVINENKNQKREINLEGGEDDSGSEEEFGHEITKGGRKGKAGDGYGDGGRDGECEEGGGASGASGGAEEEEEEDDDDDDIIQLLEKCCYKNTDWTMRGCVIFAINSISETKFGEEVLVESFNSRESSSSLSCGKNKASFNFSVSELIMNKIVINVERGVSKGKIVEKGPRCAEGDSESISEVEDRKAVDLLLQGISQSGVRSSTALRNAAPRHRADVGEKRGKWEKWEKKSGAGGNAVIRGGTASSVNLKNRCGVLKSILWEAE